MDFPLQPQQDFSYLDISNSSPVDLGCCDAVEIVSQPVMYYTTAAGLDSQGQIYLISYDNPAANVVSSSTSSSAPSTPETMSCDSGLYEHSPSPPTSATAMRSSVAVKRKSADGGESSALCSKRTAPPEIIRPVRPKTSGSRGKRTTATAIKNSLHCSQYAFPSISADGSTELRIIRQPELQHRPRYQSEGSRGRIKDITGKRSPTVELTNFHGRSALLQIFVGKDTDPVEPHPLFCFSKSAGKSAVPAVWRPYEDRTVCEMLFTEREHWQIEIDCLSLVKIRNADCPEVDDVVKKARRGAGPPRVRLIFQAILTWHNGRTETLQIASTPINCATAVNNPEITYISHTSCPAKEGCEMVLLGRNFVRDESKLTITEVSPEGVVERKTPVRVHEDKFSSVHMIASIPPHPDAQLSKNLTVFLNVENSHDKVSDFVEFRYIAVAGEASLATSPVTESIPSRNPGRPVPVQRREDEPAVILVPPAAAPVAAPSPATKALDSLKFVGSAPTMAGEPFNRLPDISRLAKPKPVVQPQQHQIIVSGCSERRVYNIGNATHYVIPIPGITLPIVISVPQPGAPSDRSTPGVSSDLADSSVQPTSLAVMSSEDENAFAEISTEPVSEETTNMFDSLMRDILGNETPAGPWYVDVGGLPMTDDVVEVAHGQAYPQ